MDPLETRGARLNSSIEVCKYTALSPSTGTYPDGVDAPAGANALFRGVAQESILPQGYDDYIGGQLQIVTGTAWPAGVRPSSATGRALAIATRGRTKAVAASAISPGDRVNIADTQGRFKTVNEGAGTLIHDVGICEGACGAAGGPSAAGDIFWLDIQPVDRKA